MQEFYLVHSTSLKNLAKIIRYGHLFTQPSRQKLRESAIIIGEGDEKRKLGHPLSTMEEIHKNDYEEAIGVYFRVFPTLESIRQPRRGTALIILRNTILQHYKWHVNYCENNGFFIRQGETAYFGNETGPCPPSEIGAIDLSKIDTEDSEILVYSDVDILANNGEYLEEIRTHKVDPKTKKRSVKYNNWMKRFITDTLKTGKRYTKYRNSTVKNTKYSRKNNESRKSSRKTV